MDQQITYSFEPNYYFRNTRELIAKYPIPLADHLHLFFIQDNWNDIGIYTRFNIIRFDEQGHDEWLGDIKIMKVARIVSKYNVNSDLYNDGLMEKPLFFLDKSVLNDYISVSSTLFRKHLYDYFNDNKDFYFNAYDLILDNLHDIMYDSKYVHDKNFEKLNNNYVYEHSLLRGFEPEFDSSMYYLNRFKILDIKRRYIININSISKKIDEELSNINNDNVLIINALILTVLIQIENYLKDLVDLNPKNNMSEQFLMEKSHTAYKLIHQSNQFIDEYINDNGSNWNKLTDMFYQLFGFSATGINSIGKLHKLRNNLAHKINEAKIDKASKKIIIAKKDKEETYSIEDIVKSIENFVEQIADKIMEHEYTL